MVYLHRNTYAYIKHINFITSKQAKRKMCCETKNIFNVIKIIILKYYLLHTDRKKYKGSEGECLSPYAGRQSKFGDEKTKAEKLG